MLGITSVHYATSILVLALVKVESVAEFAPPTISPTWPNPLLFFPFLFSFPLLSSTPPFQSPIPLPIIIPSTTPISSQPHLPPPLYPNPPLPPSPQTTLLLYETPFSTIKNWELLMDPYPSLPCCAVCKAKEEDTKKLVSCESCLRVFSSISP